MPPILSVIMPFHHEEKAMAQTLQGLEECLTVPHETLLIYDDERDPTLDSIKNIQARNASIITQMNSYKPGVSGAIKTGLERASGKYILFLVADDKGPLVLVNRMLDLMEQGYALVSGTRYATGGGVSGGGPLGKIASAWGNRLFCRLSGYRFSDATCGIKMFRRDMLRKIPLNPDSGWASLFELAIQAQYHDFKVTEIPYFSYNRRGGCAAHFKVLPRMCAYGRIFLWGIFKLHERR